MLYFIGLGLGDEKDITVRGLELVRQCSRVFLEHYTSVLQVSVPKLEEFYGRSVELADREFVESRADDILSACESGDVAFLVVGDPCGATTHTDLVLRARERGIETRIIHNASILNAVGACGLQLYHFGPSVSIVFFTDEWRPDSFYDKVAENAKRGLHTLCLLDIRVKERTVAGLLRGRAEYEPPRFMSVATAARQLLEVEAKRGEGVCRDEALAVGLARVGDLGSQRIVTATLAQMARDPEAERALGPTPLHSLILPGRLHDLESDMLRLHALYPQTFDDHLALHQAHFNKHQ